MVNLKRFAPFIVAALATAPATAVHLSGAALPPHAMALICGAAIMSASFILLWACDAAQADISPTLALAVVALIAVLPEYSVDMYFTWQAGRNPGGGYAQYAIANMTGANRLLIGVGWGAIALIFWFLSRRPVILEKERRLELLFLGLASAYAVLIPVKGNLAWYDGIVFIGLYVCYVAFARKRPALEPEATGPSLLLLSMPTKARRIATLVLFVFSAAIIGTNAEPFSEGLIGTGKAFHVNEFLLVQWLAPIASEAPEFIVAIMFTVRRQASLALGSLLAAKLNQWTLLVGMIPGVYGIAHGSFDHPIPMGSYQMHEIMLTAAQSVLAVVILSSMRLSVSQALLLIGLFFGQLLAPALIDAYPHLLPVVVPKDQVHPLFSTIYFVVAIAFFLERPVRLFRLKRGLTDGFDVPDLEAETSEAYPCLVKRESGEPARSLCPASLCPNAHCIFEDDPDCARCAQRN